MTRSAYHLEGRQAKSVTHQTDYEEPAAKRNFRGCAVLPCRRPIGQRPGSSPKGAGAFLVTFCAHKKLPGVRGRAGPGLSPPGENESKSIGRRAGAKLAVRPAAKTFKKRKKPLTSRRIYGILLKLALGKDPGSTAMMREIAAPAGNFRGVCPIIGRLRMSFPRRRSPCHGTIPAICAGIFYELE